jgi:hypothetical protein
VGGEEIIRAGKEKGKKAEAAHHHARFQMSQQSLLLLTKLASCQKDGHVYTTNYGEKVAAAAATTFFWCTSLPAAVLFGSRTFFKNFISLIYILLLLRFLDVIFHNLFFSKGGGIFIGSTFP